MEEYTAEERKLMADFIREQLEFHFDEIDDEKHDTLLALAERLSAKPLPQRDFPNCF